MQAFNMEKRKSGLYIRYSIWLTALTVIILIVFLALTVYYVRERAIVDLFSVQQASIANQVALRQEEAIAKCEKGMLMLSKILESKDLSFNEKKKGIEALYNELQGIVMVIVEIDSDNKVVNGYPDKIVTSMMGNRIMDPSVDHAMKKMNQRFTGEIRGIVDVGREKGSIPSKTIGIGIPLMDTANKYKGAVLAVVSPQVMLDRTIPINRTYMDDFWLLDESGRVVFQSKKEIVIGDLTKISPETEKMFRLFSFTAGHYGELMLNKQGVEGKYIIAYSPLRIGISDWWIVLITPFDKILKPIRSASLNIFLGAIGLVVVVVVTAVSIARSDVKRLRLKEELKRLKEREVWQGKLLREKMTIDGIIEGSPVATFVINKDHKVILWNRACTDLTGLSSDEMINTGDYYKPFYEAKRPFLADFIIDGDFSKIVDFYEKGKVMKSESIEGAYEAIKHFKNLNGKDRHLHFLAAPIYNEKGEVVAAIETFLDITKEVELARDLKEYAETLQNELGENIKLRKEVEDLYSYLQSILDSLPDKIYELNREGIINYVSRQLHRDRSSGSDPKGKHFTEYVAPEHREYAMSKWKDVNAGIFDPYELELTTKEGKRNLLMTPGPVKGTDRFVLVERDITGLKELEKKYYESQKLAAIGQLSAGIAHEVRNPLSSIKMSLQILEKRIQPEGNDLKRFKIAQREVEHLEKLVSDVLIYAKPLIPVKEPSDIGVIIEQALAMVEKSLSDKEIVVEKDYPEDVGTIHVDPALIKQSLINIFQNAAEAMEKGGRMVVSIKDSPERLTIDVLDNGCGIAEEDRPHLFNPFFTTKNYGTGLGLTQVKKIIEQHGGEIEVTGAEGRGTRFAISLPKVSG